MPASLTEVDTRMDLKWSDTLELTDVFDHKCTEHTGLPPELSCGKLARRANSIIPRIHGPTKCEDKLCFYRAPVPEVGACRR